MVSLKPKDILSSLLKFLLWLISWEQLKNVDEAPLGEGTAHGIGASGIGEFLGWLLSPQPLHFEPEPEESTQFRQGRGYLAWFISTEELEEAPPSPAGVGIKGADGPAGGGIIRWLLEFEQLGHENPPPGIGDKPAEGILRLIFSPEKLPEIDSPPQSRRRRDSKQVLSDEKTISLKRLMEFETLEEAPVTDDKTGPGFMKWLFSTEDLPEMDISE